MAKMKNSLRLENYFSPVLGNELRAPYSLGRSSTTALHPSLKSFLKLTFTISKMSLHYQHKVKTG